MENKKNVKYYQIRASVFWSVLITVGIVFAILLIGNLKNDANTQDLNKTERPELTHMAFGHIDSKLNVKSECYLCGDASMSLMGYYRKFDTVGIIGLNEWYVLDLRLQSYDENGNPVENNDGMSSSFGNSQGMDFYVNATPSRGMSSATISSTTGSFDKSVIQKNLCQYCLDKVTDTLEGYFEKGKEEYLPFCLVDFKTLDIYPMQKTNRAYSVRDYWIELEHVDSEIKVDAYYLPERDVN